MITSLNGKRTCWGRRGLRYLAVALGGFLILALCATAGVSVIAAGMLMAEEPTSSQAVVVLFHDTEIYRRMFEAARLYQEGMAEKVVINGGRKIDVLKEMEARGFTRDWRWFDEYLPFLEYLGVPREDVICLDVEDAYDTSGEARRVGEKLIAMGIHDVIVTTNKFHSRRAGFIWRGMYGDRMRIRVVPVRDEVFGPLAWLSDGRQFKWVIYEAGAWIFMGLGAIGIRG